MRPRRPSSQAELQGLRRDGHHAEPLGRDGQVIGTGGRRIMLVQPVDERCRELGGSTALPARPECVEMEGLEVLAGQPRGVVLEALLEADHGIVDGTSGHVRPRERHRPGDEPIRVPTHPVETDGLHVGRQRDRVVVRTEPEHSRRSRRLPARSTPRCGSSRGAVRPGRCCWGPRRSWCGRCRTRRPACREGTTRRRP